jgi:hypothetical protein
MKSYMSPYLGENHVEALLDGIERFAPGHMSDWRRVVFVLMLVLELEFC